MTNEQKIAIEYYIALVQKYELAGSVVQRGRHPYGIIKSENDQVEMQFNAERLRWVVNSSIEDSVQSIKVDVVNNLRSALLAAQSVDQLYFDRLAQRLQGELDRFFSFMDLGKEEVLWDGTNS